MLDPPAMNRFIEEEEDPMRGSSGRFLTGSFVCPHCENEHPMFVQRCPSSGLHVEKVYRMTGETIDGKYEVGPLIGMGGMGVVYEASHLRIGRKLAIKFLGAHVMASQQAIVRFENEARVAASVGHRHIVDVMDLGETEDGVRYIVMEYLPGRDLGDILDASGSLPVDRSIDFAIQILSALRAVHEQGIIHRDLKPENVRVTGGPGRPLEVKIVDFGVSRLVGSAGADLGLTRTGTVVGTPRYMAPEQARGRKEIDRRVDLYSAGVLLYRMLTGALPFDGENYNDVLIAITTEQPTDVRSHGVKLPEGLSAAVMKSISRDPEGRFATADEFFEAIRGYRDWSDAQAEEDVDAAGGAAHVKHVPMLDWSGIERSPAVGERRSGPARASSRYSVSHLDNPTGMTDVVPGRLRVATPRIDGSRADSVEKAEIADAAVRVDPPMPSVSWREPGAISRHVHVKTPAGGYERRSNIMEMIAESARTNGRIGTPSGAVAVPKDIRPNPSAAGLEKQAPQQRDSVSIEGWVGFASVPPPRPRARARRRWLLVSAAACGVLAVAAGTTAIIASHLGDSDRSGEPGVSAADAGPSEATRSSAGGMEAVDAVRYWKVDLGKLPQGASVWVDGVLHPERPVLIEVVEGSRSIRFEAEGHEAWERTVAVAADLALEVVMAAADGKAKADEKGKKGKKKSRIDTEYPGSP